MDESNIEGLKSVMDTNEERRNLPEESTDPSPKFEQFEDWSQWTLALAEWVFMQAGKGEMSAPRLACVFDIVEYQAKQLSQARASQEPRPASGKLPFGWWDVVKQRFYRLRCDAEEAMKGGNNCIPLFAGSDQVGCKQGECFFAAVEHGYCKHHHSIISTTGHCDGCKPAPSAGSGRCPTPKLHWDEELCFALIEEFGDDYNKRISPILRRLDRNPWHSVESGKEGAVERAQFQVDHSPYETDVPALTPVPAQGAQIDEPMSKYVGDLKVQLAQKDAEIGRLRRALAEAHKAILPALGKEVKP